MSAETAFILGYFTSATCFVGSLVFSNWLCKRLQKRNDGIEKEEHK